MNNILEPVISEKIKELENYLLYLEAYKKGIENTEMQMKVELEKYRELLKQIR